MIRLLSGDLGHWVDGPSPCGRTYPRLPDGVYGRIDEMFQVRGENVYPSEIDNVLTAIADYGGEHRVVISREGTMDELLVQAEATDAVQAAGDAATAELGRRIARELHKVLGLRARVEVVDPRTFPRSEHKARRVIDDRDLFRSLQQKLEG